MVSGDELKLIVRLARRRAMPFAFCPDSDSDEPLFATHRKKPPEMIARVTRRDSGQSKIAFGTFVVQGRLMVLTCEKELPAIAKKLKRHLKAQKLPMNVRVLDRAGEEIEADIDDFDDPDPLGPEDDPLDQRIAAMRPQVAGLKGQRGERIRDLFSALTATQQNGRRSHAEDLADRLEEELQRLRNSSHRPQVAASRPAAVEAEIEEAEEEAPADRRVTLALARRARALHRRVKALADDEAADRLGAALQLAVGALKAGETESAGAALERIGAALARVEARG